jgi:hypothetical protein
MHTAPRILAILAVGVFAGSAAAADARKPNIIVLLSDDVGWAEYRFQGGKDIPTPHVDSIAKNGVRFTNGYIAATYCSPCRAGLMTGRYPTRFGHEFNEGGPMGNARGFGPAARGKEDDISEANDLSAAMPEKVTELKADWDKWNAEQKDPLWKPLPAAEKAKNKAKNKDKNKAKDKPPESEE